MPIGIGIGLQVAGGSGRPAPHPLLGFTPYACYDASFGGSAAGIPDSSANGRSPVTNGAATAAAAFTAAGGGSPAYFTFDGSNDFMAGPAAALPPMLAASSFTIVTVARQPETRNAYGRLFSLRNGASAGTDVLNLDNTAKVYTFISDGTDTLDTSAFASTYTHSTWLVIVSRVTPTELNTSTNGVDETSRAIGATIDNRTPPGGFRLGSTVNGSNFSNGQIRAVLLFDRSLSTVHEDAIVAYFGGGT